MSAALERFYGIIGELMERQGAPRFADLDGRMAWPERGVYFVFEPGEQRLGRPDVPRVVRVGTHALNAGSRTTLWNRLRQHRGSRASTGNHRGSVFRMHVGRALIGREGLQASYPEWDRGGSAPREVVQGERVMEQMVSEAIGRMRVAWVAVLDDPGPTSGRGLVERGAIALLASDGHAADLPSRGWLGRYAPSEAIRGSGLWNVHHVGATPERSLLDVLEACAEAT